MQKIVTFLAVLAVVISLCAAGAAQRPGAAQRSLTEPVKDQKTSQTFLWGKKAGFPFGPWGYPYLGYGWGFPYGYGWGGGWGGLGGWGGWGGYGLGGWGGGWGGYGGYGGYGGFGGGLWG